MEEKFIKIWVWHYPTLYWTKDHISFNKWDKLRHLTKAYTETLWVPENSTDEEIDVMVKVLDDG